MPSRVSSTSDVCLYFLAIFLPPVPVFLKVGCAADFWINILLCILAYLPGIIHAWWVISRHEDSSGGGYRYNPSHGTTADAPPPWYSDKTTAPPTTAPAPAPAPGTTGYGATPETTGASGVTAKPVY